MFGFRWVNRVIMMCRLWLMRFVSRYKTHTTQPLWRVVVWVGAHAILELASAFMA